MRLQGAGRPAVEIDLQPFFEAARLLYDGPWIAERLAEPGRFLRARRPRRSCRSPAEILGEGRRVGGVEVFAGLHRLGQLQRQVAAAWQDCDVLVLPTTPTIYTIEQIAADPAPSTPGWASTPTSSTCSTWRAWPSRPASAPTGCPRASA